MSFIIIKISVFLGIFSVVLLFANFIDFFTAGECVSFSVRNENCDEKFLLVFVFRYDVKPIFVTLLQNWSDVIVRLYTNFVSTCAMKREIFKMIVKHVCQSRNPSNKSVISFSYKN